MIKITSRLFAMTFALCAYTAHANTNPSPSQTTTPSTATAIAAPTTMSTPLVNTSNATPASAITQAPKPDINCEYPIPANQAQIDNALLSTWARKATMQSFDFNATNIDAQLERLKLCYTTQGWQGFTDALTKSGNVEAIKLQHLTVSSQVDGEVTITPVKENQWKIIVPLHVVYQNEKERLTQRLNIDLFVGRNVSGSLGILQIVATPRESNEPLN